MVMRFCREQGLLSLLLFLAQHLVQTKFEESWNFRVTWDNIEKKWRQPQCKYFCLCCGSNVFIFPTDKSRQFLTSSPFFSYLSIPYGVQERLLQCPLILGPEVLGPLMTCKIPPEYYVLWPFIFNFTFNVKLIYILITGTKLMLISSYCTCCQHTNPPC